MLANNYYSPRGTFIARPERNCDAKKVSPKATIGRGSLPMGSKRRRGAHERSRVEEAHFVVIIAMDLNYVIVKLSPIARVTRRNATSTKGLISRDSSLPSSRTFFQFFLPYRRSFDRASFPVISFHFQNLAICERRVKIAVNRTTSITFTECPTKCARSAVDVDRSN